MYAPTSDPIFFYNRRLEHLKLILVYQSFFDGQQRYVFKNVNFLLCQKIEQMYMPVVHAN